ncbi:MAG: hypothetical protein AAGD05_15975, partial [Bacteroidota bacterium]
MKFLNRRISHFLCLLCFPAFLSAQWEAFPLGINEKLNIWDTEVVDANTVWAITTAGEYDANLWAITPSATFLRTADGGANWTIGQLPLPDGSWGGWKVSAIDDNTAWVAASNPFDLGAAIYKTTDGGTSWKQQSVFSSISFCTVVHFWDAHDGIAIGDPLNGRYEIYRTNDGGATWSLVDAQQIPAPLFAWEYVTTSACSVIDDHIWFGTYGSRVFHSPDRGQTWTASTTPIALITSNPWVEGLTFRDSLHGIAYSANYNNVPYQHLIAYTEDGGQTWVQQPIQNSDFALFKAQYIKDTNLLFKT